MQGKIIKFIEEHYLKMEKIILKSTKPNGEFIEGFYTGGVSEERIQAVESELKIEFPADYRWFLKKFGSGGSYGVNIIGITLPSAPPRILTQTGSLCYSFSGSWYSISFR